MTDDHNMISLKRIMTDALTKKLVEEGKLIEAGWVSLRTMAIASDAPPIQLDEMRMAFFAGAQHLFGSIMTVLDDDKEPTDADIKRMESISNELNQFIEEFKLRNLKSEGSA